MMLNPNTQREHGCQPSKPRLSIRHMRGKNRMVLGVCKPTIPISCMCYNTQKEPETRSSPIQITTNFFNN